MLKRFDDFWFMTRLRYECFRPARTFSIIPSSKLVYIAVQKAGCTSIRAAIGRDANGGKAVGNVHSAEHSGIPGIREFGVSKFRQLLADEEVFVFTFVRNPFSRITSLYTDKIGPVPLGENNPFMNGLRRSLKKSALRNLDQNAPMPFEDYVEHVCETCHKRVNLHWNLMSDIIPNDLVRIDHVGKLESFEADMQPVLDRMHHRKPARQDLSKPRNVSRNELKKTVVWDSASVEKVIAAYSRDFERFSYAPELPGELLINC